MSSGSKIELLNQILDARYAVMESRPEGKQEAWAEYERLVSAALEGHPLVSREELERAIKWHWRDYLVKRKRFR